MSQYGYYTDRGSNGHIRIENIRDAGNEDGRDAIHRVSTFHNTLAKWDTDYGGIREMKTVEACEMETWRRDDSRLYQSGGMRRG
jgi:hypothetical protein